MTVSNKHLLSIERVFSDAETDPFQEITWNERPCEILDPAGNIVFKQDAVEVPSFWSQTATNVVASKYFYGKVGSADREQSVAELIKRVTRTITDWGIELHYFSREVATLFERELRWLLVNQYAAFNSPVWFNCGLYQYKGITDGVSGGFYYDLEKNRVARTSNHYEYPQCSACFIQSVDDTMESLMSLAVSEAYLFKYGSGTGTDLSTIRSSREDLSGGGHPSGPLSFLGIYDKIAGIVKSGGKTRRAAKMNTLKVSHPDVMEFITAKMVEERKAHVLIDGGYDGSFNGEAYATVAYQNENLSLRVTSEFMEQEQQGGDWQTYWVSKPDKLGPKYKARDMLKAVATGTHFCGDPGLQYEDMIQQWHTCKNDGPINSSNPCSEYMFLDDTACNLASINLLKFRDENGTFNVGRFTSAVKLLITAQDILVDKAAYPTKEITKNSHMYRTLGLGYANLGAFLMSLGLAYDSDEGRAMASVITAIMHMAAYRQSAELARVKGPFERFAANNEPMMGVLRLHESALALVDADLVDIIAPGLYDAALDVARAAVIAGDTYGYRNAQVTVLAPTGTISFLMDCDTTGVEPDIALVKYKLLASTERQTEGGVIKLVNRTVPMALSRLGYDRDTITAITQYIDEHDTIEGAPGLRDEHLTVFDCAFKPANGTRYIPYQAHLKMMAAVQPFLSGAISKTVNVPEDATVDDIIQVYRDGWRMCLKAVAVYRENSKRSQPLSTSVRKSGESDAITEEPAVVKCVESRERMPSVRDATTHKFDIGPHEGYVTLGFYPDGRLGEMFVTMAKEGSTIRGLMDCWATAISIGLQYGVPFSVYRSKFEHTRFEPSGFCNGGSPIKSCSSLPDYIFRWTDQFLEARSQTPVQPSAPAAAPHASAKLSEVNRSLSSDAPPCDRCGAITIRNGTCFKCNNCGNSLGCS